jgi:adenylate cyclase
MDIKDGINALLPVARSVLGLYPDLLKRLGPADLTILFTDIESFTAITDSRGDAAAQDLLRTHNAIVRGALTAHGGHEIKHTGDGIMAYFISASRAVTAAVEIQRTIERGISGASQGTIPRTIPRIPAQGHRGDQAPLSVRIGLNTGEPILEEGDLYGTPVIIAARVADLARGGQILVTDIVRQLVAGKGLDLRPVGSSQLQGISGAIDLFEVVWDDARSKTPPSVWSL